MQKKTIDSVFCLLGGELYGRNQNCHILQSQFYYDFHKLSVLMIGRSSLETVLMNGSVYTMDILSGFLIIPTDYIGPCAF